MSPDGVQPNVLTVTITSTTPVGEVEVIYQIELPDGTYKREFPIKLNVIDCSDIGHVHGDGLFSSESGDDGTTFDI